MYPTCSSLVSICFAVASLWEVHKVVCSLSTAGCIEDLEDRIQSVRLANAPPGLWKWRHRDLVQIQTWRFLKVYVVASVFRVLQDPLLRNGKFAQKSRNILEYTAVFPRIPWTLSAVAIFRYLFSFPCPYRVGLKQHTLQHMKFFSKLSKFHKSHVLSYRLTRLPSAIHLFPSLRAAVGSDFHLHWMSHSQNHTKPSMICEDVIVCNKMWRDVRSLIKNKAGFRFRNNSAQTEWPKAWEHSMQTP